MERTALAPTQTAMARKLGLSDDFMRILAMRGLDTEDEILSFLRPSLDKMSSPFDIDGMREGAERIKRAILNKEKVLIFGDYDCDGIGAISILMLYLRDKLDVKYFIPNRATDPDLYNALREAYVSGVKILCLSCTVEEDELAIADNPFVSFII